MASVVTANSLFVDSGVSGPLCGPRPADNVLMIGKRLMDGAAPPRLTSRYRHDGDLNKGGFCVFLVKILSEDVPTWAFGWPRDGEYDERKDSGPYGPEQLAWQRVPIKRDHNITSDPGVRDEDFARLEVEKDS